jgi:two-component system, NtrC family, sensor kinase
MRFSLSGKIFLGVTLIIVVFGGVQVYSLYRMMRYRDDVKVLIKGLTPLSLEVRESLRSTDSLIFSLKQPSPRDIILVKNFILYLEPFRRVEQLVARTEQRRRTLPIGQTEGVDAFLAGVQDDLDRLLTGEQFYRIATRDLPSLLAMLEPLLQDDFSNRHVFRLVFDTFLDHLERTETIDQPALDLIERFLLSLKRGLFRVQKDIHRFSDQQSDRIENRESTSILTLILMTSFATLLGIIILFGARATLRPIYRLIDAVRVLSSGDYSQRIDVHGGDEIGQLAAEFNRMVASLEERDQILAEQRERLLRSERLAVIGKMASFIAHEVRNPLSSIALNTEILQEEVATGGAVDQDRLLASIMQEVDRLRDVTEQYLQYARMPAPETIDIPLAEIVSSFLQWQRPELERAGIELEVELDEGARATVDVDQVRQALVNLTQNAVEALDGRALRRVGVQVRRREGWSEIVVQDSGAGIPEDVRARVTEPFYTTRRTGTGLGLAICQEIAEQHGGALEIDSPVGEGARVRLRFPAT